MTSRIDIIGQNGNDGEHYRVEKIARAICGENQDFKLSGKGPTFRWELFIPNALRVLEVLEDE